MQIRVPLKGLLVDEFAQFRGQIEIAKRLAWFYLLDDGSCENPAMLSLTVRA